MWKRIAIVCALSFVVMSVPARAEEEQKTEADTETEEDPLAALAEMGDTLAVEAPEAGGSIRAKKDADLTAVKRRKDKRNFQAKVVNVNRRDFPLIALKVKVIKPARKGKLKSAVKKNEKVVVIPALTIKGGRPDLKDPATLINAGAFYLRKGDKVVVRLKEKKGNVWIAEYIERK